jgi:hypothetical protein
MLKSRSRLSFLLCAFLVSHCKPDPKLPALKDVVGAWEVKAATRNKRPTGILAGAYFIFTENGTMKSNLPLLAEQGEWQTKFEIVEDTLIQQSIPGARYIIKSWNDSSMTLEFSTRGIPFQLALAKTSLEKIYPVPDSVTTQ